MRLLRESEAPKPTAPSQTLTAAEKVKADALAERAKLQESAAGIIRAQQADKSPSVNLLIGRQRELERITHRISEIERLHGI